VTFAILPAFETTLDQTTYSIDSRPVHLAVLGASVAVVLLVAVVIVARRRSGALVSPLLLGLATVPAALIAFVYILRDMPYFSLFGGTDSHAASTIFRTAVHIEAAAAAIGIGAVVSVTLILALRTDNQLRLLHLAGPCLLVSAALVGAAVHARSIIDVGSMPFYAAKGQKQMHVGRDRDVAVTLMHPPWRHWLFGSDDGPQPIDEVTLGRWTHVDHVHVHATAAGPILFTAEARRGPVTLTTKLAAQAVPEIASPLFSLRVGDRSVYRVRARSSDGALLYFITLSGNESIHEMTVEVSGTRIRDGFRTFVITVHRDDTVREVEVVAIAGETRVYDAEKGTVGEPIVAFDAETSGPDPVPCTFALLNASNALCQRGGRPADVPAAQPPGLNPGAHRAGSRSKKDPVARPPVAFAGAAPMTFQRNTSSTGGGIATVFVAIITIGLVILPDGSSSSSYTLVSTQRGPEGAPEALPN
jgi:hypothetical protein